ncbi:MAG: LysR substrate-binding domain-containing protein [Mangrovicoccus sp.]|nr:LysR substrate-binding domain-containing protein [Mangrovicoccus sp.]
MKLTLSQLRSLEALLRKRSFSGAAADLGISQPSVSNNIKALEEFCAAPLLIRHGQKLEPSDLSKALIPKLRALVTLSTEIEHQMLAARELEQGLLRIGYTTYQYAIPILSRFAKTHPSMRIEASSMASADLLKQLSMGEIDVAFVTGQTAPKGLVSHEIIHTEIVLVLPERHPLAKAREVGWAELSELQILRRERSSATRQIFDAAAKRAGVHLERALDLGSWGSLRAAVVAGLGGCLALREEIEDADGLAVLRIRDPNLWAKHFLVCAPEMRKLAMVDGVFAACERIDAAV